MLNRYQFIADLIYDLYSADSRDSAVYLLSLYRIVTTWTINFDELSKELSERKEYTSISPFQSEFYDMCEVNWPEDYENLAVVYLTVCRFITGFIESYVDNATPNYWSPYTLKWVATSSIPA